MEIIPRPYQTRFTNASLQALNTHGNSLGIAPTGAGKTIMLAILSGQVPGRKLILQHRDELVAQNSQKYKMVNPNDHLGFYDGVSKSWGNDATFAMQQTLAGHLHSIPHIDLCIIDEAHRVAAPTYQQILERVREVNPACKIFGVTATPERGDSKSLRDTFSNVSDQITINELIALGFLVTPRAFVIDVGGIQEQIYYAKGSDYGDQEEIEAIMNNVAVTSEVIREWKEKAGNRQTIIFASSVKHAKDVCDAYNKVGIKAACIYGDMDRQERSATVQAYCEGKIQVLTNCMVLIEGFDAPPTSCVVLLRKCSAKGPMVQMIGRGLRILNPEEFPGWPAKTDCVVLDFGTSIITHGDLNQDDGLHVVRERADGDTEVATKKCPVEWQETYRYPDVNGKPGCGAEVPVQTKTCPFCGFVFERIDGKEDKYVESVQLTEVDIINASPFRYVDLYNDGLCMMCSGFDAWAGVFSNDGGVTWAALGADPSSGQIHKLAVTNRLAAFTAADDYMRQHESSRSAKKKARWMDQAASAAQAKALNTKYGYSVFVDQWGRANMSKYQAACHFNFQKAFPKIMGVLAA